MKFESNLTLLECNLASRINTLVLCLGPNADCQDFLTLELNYVVLRFDLGSGQFFNFIVQYSNDFHWKATGTYFNRMFCLW